MKKALVAAAAFACMTLGAGAASAATVFSDLTINFASGAVFTGVIELEDDFSRAWSINGTLTGYQSGVSGYQGSGSVQIAHLYNGGVDQVPEDLGAYDFYRTRFSEGECSPSGCPNQGHSILFEYIYFAGTSRPILWQAQIDGRDHWEFGPSQNFSIGVPEPSTWAMMITGFGLAGTAVRRRRRLEALAY